MLSTIILTSFTDLVEEGRACRSTTKSGLLIYLEGFRASDLTNTSIGTAQGSNKIRLKYLSVGVMDRMG